MSIVEQLFNCLLSMVFAPDGGLVPVSVAPEARLRALEWLRVSPSRVRDDGVVGRSKIEQFSSG